MEVARGGLILLLLTSAVVSSSSSEVIVPVTYVGPQNATEVISELELSGQAGRPLTVHVEGIVGTGKSTMLKAFENETSVDVLPEPVEQWTNLNGTDVLDLIFTDPHRWGEDYQDPQWPTSNFPTQWKSIMRRSETPEEGLLETNVRRDDVIKNSSTTHAIWSVSNAVTMDENREAVTEDPLGLRSIWDPRKR